MSSSGHCPKLTLKCPGVCKRYWCLVVPTHAALLVLLALLLFALLLVALLLLVLLLLALFLLALFLLALLLFALLLLVLLLLGFVRVMVHIALNSPSHQ